MAAASWFKYSYHAFIARPKADRQLYRLFKRHEITRIVEVGIGSLERSVTLIEVAQRFALDKKVAYTGLDWFDARPVEQQPLTLKQAHATLAVTAAQVRLVPGAPAQSLANIANSHPNTELLLVSKSVSDGELETAWFYVPRMLRATSHVLRERLEASGETAITPLKIVELADRADRAAARRAA